MTANNGTTKNEMIEEMVQRAVIVGFNRNERFAEIDIDESMNELGELTLAAGAEVLGMMIQNKQTPDPATLIGKGKVLELKEMADNMGANIIIFNDELTGAQLRNLEAVIGITVIDRTALILDIFARRARTKVAKLQVELAQLQYRLPRLKGLGEGLSRTGAGIGTRGPGEQKLEIDRRRVNERISDIRKQINEAGKVRETQRAQRTRNEIPVVAVVGYTNAGKSTLMNKLISMSIEADEEKMVFAKNMLFATLDTYTRRIEFDDNKPFVLVDTVGFVSKLPHALVQAFKATLEEVVEADLIIHVVDASTEHYKLQISVTNNVLGELGAGEKPEVIAYNKIDLVEDRGSVPKMQDIHHISAVTGEGIDELIQNINSHIFSDITTVEMLIPFSDGAAYSQICEVGNVLETEYLETGTQVKVELKAKDYNKYKKYVTQ